MTLEKVYKAAVTLAVLLLLSIIALLLFKPEVPKDVAAEDLGKSLAAVTVIRLEVKPGYFSNCRKKRDRFYADLRELLTKAGYKTADSGYGAELLVKLRCKGDIGRPLKRLEVRMGERQLALLSETDLDAVLVLLAKAKGFPFLENLLSHSGFRPQAINAMGDLKDPAAIGPLCAVIEKEPEEREAARCEGAGMEQELDNEGLYREKEEAYQSLFQVVKANKTRENLDRTIPLFIKGIKRYRSDIIRMLGGLGDPRGIGPIIEVLGIEACCAPKELDRIDPAWRGSAAAKAAYPRFVADMKKGNGDATMALGVMGGSGAVRVLIAALADEKQENRDDIAWGLGAAKDPAAIDALIAALGSKAEDGQVAFQAGNSLSKITGQDFGYDPVKWSEWRSKNRAAAGK